MRPLQQENVVLFYNFNHLGQRSHSFESFKAAKESALNYVLAALENNVEKPFITIKNQIGQFVATIDESNI